MLATSLYFLLYFVSGKKSTGCKIFTTRVVGHSNYAQTENLLPRGLARRADIFLPSVVLSELQSAATMAFLTSSDLTPSWYDLG
jgi:hypothetical protein